MSQGCCCGGGGCCESGAADVPVVATSLTSRDVFGAWKARLGIGRMEYRVEPGLYAVGKPDENAPVLVSANYKLTFDTLRKNLGGVDCWLLILDTKGINVWCAAGKGTFGTCELAQRIEAVGLSDVVAHRKLILPQLGASGVNAPEVERRTGFTIAYGPVRANDIKAYLAAGCKASREMRAVRFTLRDRLVLTPIELITAIKTMFPVFGVLFLLNLICARPFGGRDAIAYAGAVFAGTVLTPALLPMIPGPAFSWKGWLLGLIWTAAAVWQSGWFTQAQWPLAAGYLLLLPSVSAYIAMNFTGCSTYTSPSGVLKEMKKALPLIVGATIIGAALVLVHKLFG